MIISCRDNKGNGVKGLYKLFSEKRWNVSGLETLVQKLIGLTRAQSIDHQVLGAHDEPTCTSITDRTGCLKSQIMLTRRSLCRRESVRGLPSWLTARPSTSWMLAGVNMHLQR